MLYFLINDLWKINQMYYFSLKAFLTVSCGTQLSSVTYLPFLCVLTNVRV